MESKRQDAEQQIIESAPQIILETTEEFLRTFTLSDFSNKKMIDDYKNIAKSVNPIGSPSTFGTIHDMSDGNVLKVIKMCPRGTDMSGEPPYCPGIMFSSPGKFYYFTNTEHPNR